MNDKHSVFLLITNSLRSLFYSSIFFVLIVSCGKKSGEKSKASQQGPQIMNVDGLVVEPRALENKITSTGTLLANEEIELRPEISGRIVDISFKEGSPVKKGQLLVKINDSELKAQLKKLEIQDQLLKDRERRSKLLYEKEGISEEEYETALNNFKTNRAEIELVKSQIAKTAIIAPFDGVIGLRNASEGGFVSSTGLIATLQQLNPIKIEFTVPEKSAPAIKAGTPIQYTVEGMDQVFDAKVYAVEAAVDVNTRSVKIRAKGENPENKLKPGAFAKVEIIVEVIPNALMVPSEVVVPVLQGHKVFTARHGVAISSPVKTGIRTEREIQILEGLSPQDTVIVSGIMSLKDSAKVNVRDLKQNKAAEKS